MAQHQGNGRNPAAPDEHRPSWRVQDEERDRRGASEDEDRYMRDRIDRRMDQRYGSHWEDRSSRWGREEGRYDEDRRNLGYPSHMEERAREREMDERYAQRRGGRWSEQDRERMRSVGGGGYGHGAYEGMSGGGYLGQGGQMMGREVWGNEGYAGGTSYGDQSGYGAMQPWRGEWQRVEREGQRWREPEWRGRDWQGGPPEGMRGPGTYGQGYGGSQGMYGQQPMQHGGRGAQGHGGVYGQGGYNEGMYGRGGMQNRYGSQGYQGWGQEPGVRSYRGKGPAGYTRSDERIRETVCEILTEHDQIDATNIEVTVKNGEVVLSGTVEDRRQKRLAEDVVADVSGVKDVQNQIRVSAEKQPSTSTETEKRGRA